MTQLVHARVRRRFQRGLKRRAATLMTKLRKAKTEAPPNEKPAAVKTHLRDMVVVPEMIGSVIGIYNGKIFNTVEIKPEMTGHYLGEFSISYVPPSVPPFVVYWRLTDFVLRNLSSMVVRGLVLPIRQDLFH